MGKPEAPTPPNPYQTAAAQTGTNVSTSVANAFLNNVNQNTPTGSLNYTPTGSYGWTDPSTGQTYNIPTFTSTQTLSPTQQAIAAQNEAAQFNLAGMANAQSGRISDWLSQPMDLSGAPPASRISGLGLGGAMRTFDKGPEIKYEFADAGPLTRSYGPGDFSADRTHVEQSLMDRMNPQLARERGNIEQRLADQGIRYGSAAYTGAMDDYNRQANDARFAAVSQAGQEQQRMMDMAAQRAGFENAAQQQNYEQLLGRASFWNAAQQQNFGQNAALAAFNNAGLAQDFGMAKDQFNAQNLLRNQYMQEQYQARNQPLNEIGALLSGGQVTNPTFMNPSNNQIPTTDIAGILNQNFQNQMGIYNNQSQSWNSLMGGILGLGAGAMKLSDEREKENVSHMGTVFAATPKGERKELPIYSYSYVKDVDHDEHVGPMAQDVEKIDKSAVVSKGGRKFIKPGRVMGSILRAA